MQINVDLNPITVEFEYGQRDTARYVVYLYDEVVKKGEWEQDSHFWNLSTDEIRQEYTRKYQQFLVKRFVDYLESNNV